jgi:hypothetical protein
MLTEPVPVPILASAFWQSDAVGLPKGHAVAVGVAVVDDVVVDTVVEDAVHVTDGTTLSIGGMT